MKHPRKPRATRALIAGAVGVASLAAMTVGGSAGAAPPVGNDLGFTPITTNALACSATGLPLFANDRRNQPVTPMVLMKTGDPATPVNAPATSTAVGRENDMIALTPDGRYLFTVSENAAFSDGVTRLTLKGRDAGKKEILALPTPPATWARVDGAKWYPFGGSSSSAGGERESEDDREAGVLLVSEEFSTGGIWQVDPNTGAFTRLDWLGNFSHEGIGLDAAGNLYLGDENRTGALYKAVPNNPRDLTQGGVLSYLVGTAIDASGWKAVVNPANAITEANTNGAILFDRPEDFDERNGRVYFTVTEPQGDSDPRKGAYDGTPADGGSVSPLNQVVNRGGVYSVNTVGVPDLAVQSGAAPYTKLTPMIEVQDPEYATQADAQAQQGLQYPDNIAFDSRGRLWVHEDIPDDTAATPTNKHSKQYRNQQDELYTYVLNSTGTAIVPNPTSLGGSGGYKAADMRTSDAAHPCENEFTGGIFGQEGKTLFINQQHWSNPTLAVRFGGSDK